MPRLVTNCVLDSSSMSHGGLTTVHYWCHNPCRIHLREVASMYGSCTTEASEPAIRFGFADAERSFSYGNGSFRLSHFQTQCSFSSHCGLCRFHLHVLGEPCGPEHDLRS